MIGSLEIKSGFEELMKHNQFAQGGLMVAAATAVWTTMKSVPQKIVYTCERQFTMSLSITDDSDAFRWLREWFTTHPKMAKVRQLDAAQGRNGRGYFITKDSVVMNPAPGLNHWFWYKGRPMKITLSRTEAKTQSDKRSESFHMTCFGRDPKYIRDLLDDMRVAYQKNKVVKAEMYTMDSGSVEELEGYEPRTLDTVILPSGIKDTLIKDIDHFKANETWYKGIGIPYHRGYLFHGLPGTGKTSLVTGLSEHFKAPVYVFRLQDMTDGSLASAVAQVSKGGMIVFEDVDCVKSTQKRVKDPIRGGGKNIPEETPSYGGLGGVTLSGFLNVLDGMMAPNGAMFFMTTNHVEHLDPAMIRPGRVDVKIHFGHATESQKRELWEKFYPNLDVQVPDDIMEKPMTMAELQGYLLEQKGVLSV